MHCQCNTGVTPVLGRYDNRLLGFTDLRNT